jgi:hypothetical protein
LEQGIIKHKIVLSMITTAEEVPGFGQLTLPNDFFLLPKDWFLTTGSNMADVPSLSSRLSRYLL